MQVWLINTLSQYYTITYWEYYTPFYYDFIPFLIHSQHSDSISLAYKYNKYSVAKKFSVSIINPCACSFLFLLKSKHKLFIKYKNKIHNLSLKLLCLIMHCEFLREYTHIRFCKPNLCFCKSTVEAVIWYIHLILVWRLGFHFLILLHKVYNI